MKRNKIYTGNCAEVMATFPNECIDLTVTSPPYDNLRDYEGYDFDFEAIATELYRVTKQGGVVVWVVGDGTENGSETTTSAEQKIFFRKLGFNIHDTMIYQKSGCSMPDKTRYFQTFEYMFVFSKGAIGTVNFIKDRKNRFRERWGKSRKARNKDGTNGIEYVSKKAPEFGKRFNIWKYNQGGGYGQNDKIAYEHPATFPEALARDHIMSWSNPGDVILDPMCGSGTTLKMARETGRDFVGIDMSEKYVKIAEKRVAGAKMPLFV